MILDLPFEEFVRTHLEEGSVQSRVFSQSLSYSPDSGFKTLGNLSVREFLKHCNRSKFSDYRGVGKGSIEAIARKFQELGIRWH